MSNTDPRKVVDIASEPTTTRLPSPYEPVTTSGVPLVPAPKLMTISELAHIAFTENRVVRARRRPWPCVLWLKPHSRHIPAMHLSDLAANDWYEVKE